MHFLNNLKIPFFSVLFVFLGVFLYAKFAPPIPFSINSVQTNQSATFDVQGTGTMVVVPDSAYIIFEVTQSADTLANAQQQASARINKAIAGLKQNGITDKDIKTVSYAITPGLQPTSKDTALTVDEQISVTVSQLERTNTIMKLLSGYDVNLESAANLAFSESLKKSILNQLRMKAVADAKETARSLAQAAGIHIGRILNIQENLPTFPDPMSQAMINLTQQTGQPNQQTSINPTANTITTTVTISYQTY